MGRIIDVDGRKMVRSTVTVLVVLGRLVQAVDIRWYVCDIAAVVSSIPDADVTTIRLPVMLLSEHNNDVSNSFYKVFSRMNIKGNQFATI